MFTPVDNPGSRLFTVVNVADHGVVTAQAITPSRQVVVRHEFTVDLTGGLEFLDALG